MNPRVLVVVGLACFAGLSPAKSSAATNEAQFLTGTRQLVFEGRRSGEGYFAPDGKQLIFQSEREPGNPFYQIYILDLESGDSHRVSPGIGKTTCAFFRPGTDEVLFASTHTDPEARAKQQAELAFRASGQQRRYSWDYDDEMEIFVARRDGTQLRRLTNARGYDAEGSFSPDGSKIVFTSMRDAFPTERLSDENRTRWTNDPSYFGEIYIMNADGSGQRRLTQSPGYDGGPFFSPDGDRIIWRRFNEAGDKADIYTMRLDGSDVRRLTDFDSMAWAPSYHPSGQYVIFTSNKLGFANFELHIVDSAGEREPVRITFTDGFDGLPVFSPDGKRLCWSSVRTADGQSQLFLTGWNHAAALAALQLSPKATRRVAANSPLSSSLTSEITAADLQAHVGFLAADALEGRLTGSTGARTAADYIAAAFERDGLSRVTDAFRASSGSVAASQRNSFFEEFQFTSGVTVVADKNSLGLETTRNGAAQSQTFRLDQDFRPLSFTANESVEGEVVFAGYGLALPNGQGAPYDSYAGLNVSNRVVLVLRYVPEGVDPKRKQELNRYSGLRYKATIARAHGAKALLIVSGPNSPTAGALVPLSMDGALSGSGLAAFTVSTNVAQAILNGAGLDLKAVQTELDTENPHAQPSLAITNVHVRLRSEVASIQTSDRNVLGVLPPPRPTPDAGYILVGAHYDHLGRGEMNTLAGKEEEGQIHNGADDNASGVAAVLELAAAFAAESKASPDLFQYGLIFGLWSGEELGLIGSSYFAEHLPVPSSNIVACLNFDMVGRLRENKLILQGIGSSTAWKRIIERRNVPAGFDLSLQDDPYLPTDVTSFYPKGIPVLNFFTGSHEDYHRPTDDADKINYDGMERISRFARGVLMDLLRAPERPDYVKVEGRASGGGRDTLRVYLGTIPDYATETKGVKLSGVQGNSPADKAGVKGGDVIVEFAGQKVENIYDYTFALDAARIGQPVDIAILRDGNRIPLKIIPEARK